MTKKKIDKYVKKREVVTHKLSSFKTFIDSLEIVETESDQFQTKLLELENRQAELVGLRNQFSDIQDSIDDLTDKLEEQLNIRSNFENDFYSVQALSSQLINKHKIVEVVRELKSQNVDSSKTQINFPEIKLSNFDGKFENWI